MNFSDLVFIQEGALSAELCDSIVKDFESYNEKDLTAEGRSGRGVDHGTKRSKDIDLIATPELHSKYTDEIVKIFDKSLIDEYLAKLPHTDKFAAYPEMFYGPTYYEVLNVQKYEKGIGHYNAWHIEAGSFAMSKRMFVFLVYLNDVKEGGETELMYEGQKIQPKKGTLVIWPSSFPYVHKGHMPISDDKYILTTWLSFRPE